MKRFLFFSLLILPLSVFAKGGLPDKPYIYVEGIAAIEKPADMLTLHFNVIATAPVQPKANQEVQTKANKIFAILKERKIADSDVIAQNIRTEPQFEEEEQHGHRRNKLIGYRVVRQFEVKLRDVAVYPKVINDLIALGGVEFSQEVRSERSDRNEIEEQLRDRALANARERADKTAKAMGVKIDSVFAISTAEFPKIEEAMFSSDERVIVTGMNIPPPMPAPEYRLAPITLSQSVHVIYLISPAK